ncbi:MAG: UvrD-helicase domain-containing protein [Bacteroidota bacterium]|nr:UvrD-helicase domain-containing protein [Bacteroidota bacterium]
MSDTNFTVYKSSAGSGKTFTLVKEYLAIALNDAADPPQAYRHILAVTFTNKASAEMKERIIKALKELSEENHETISSGSKTLLAELKKHEKLNALKQLDDKTIRQRSQKILTAILHNYSDFAIGTIDSFVHRVVRTFAFDLRIPMSFEIEMDDDKLLTQAIDLLIAKVGTDELLTKALIEFTEKKTDDEKSWHIENDLKNFAKNLLNEEGSVYIEKLRHLGVDDFFGIRDTLFEEIRKFEAAVTSEAKQASERIRNAGLTAKQFYQSDKGIAGYFEKVGNGRMDYLSPNNYVLTTRNEDKWHAGKITPEERSAIDSIKGNLLDHYTRLQTIIEAGHQDYILFTLINRNIYSLAVLNEIEKLLEEYKSQNNILHISEFNKMISKIVLTEPIPFIYERLGEKYNNYLIDEFQDTSVLQFQNLLPLIDNSLASGHFTMLVGDGKQAIYRWRGGEVEQFSELPNVFRHNDNPLILERQDALVRNYNPKNLGTNYRSKKEVIEFNNSVFRVLGDALNEKYRKIYDEMEQGFREGNTGGFVQVEFLVDEEKDQREENLRRTYELIIRLSEANYQLKDISILVRKNSDGSDIANYLKGKGIEVISSESLLLSNSPEVSFIHSLLKYLANTGNNILQAEILEYMVLSGYIPSSNIDELLGRKNSSGLLKILTHAGFEINVTKLSKMALYELCEELILIFRLNAKPNAYIQFFLDEVLNYTIKKNNNLNDFIEYWEDKKSKASLIVPMGMNAVSIMTIHRSKGLEFPVVILPFSNGKVDTGKKNLWIDLENKKIPELTAALVPTSKELTGTPFGPLYEEEKNKSLLDNLNVLYVAFTRAEERLYVISGKPGKTTSNLTTITDMLAFYYQSKGLWDDQKSVYTYGNELPHVAHKAKTETTGYVLRSFNSNRWREHIKMRAAAPGIWNTQLSEVKKDYGVVVHTALARVKVAADVIPALESMLAEGLITTEEQENLIPRITGIIEMEELRKYFIPGLTIKNEAEIITKEGVMFRPDRVVLTNKEAVIIDYKTGAEKEKNRQQIIEYGDLLTAMGYEVKEKLLVYIELEKVVSV